jgi:hypothetical protein
MLVFSVKYGLENVSSQNIPMETGTIDTVHLHLCQYEILLNGLWLALEVIKSYFKGSGISINKNLPKAVVCE